MLEGSGEHRGKGAGDKDKGVRAEALHLLAEIAVNSPDANSSRDAMCILLWFSVDGDVEIRSKVINTIIGDVLKHCEDVDREVTIFAVHALVQVVDFDTSRVRTIAPTSDSDMADPDAWIERCSGKLR
jgi:hypothetical protein